MSIGGFARGCVCGPPPGVVEKAAWPLSSKRGKLLVHGWISIPLDKELIDVHFLVPVAAETGLALIADRKAPSLGLESPNEISADSGW